MYDKFAVIQRLLVVCTLLCIVFASSESRCLAGDDIRRKYIEERKKLTDYDIEMTAHTIDYHPLSNEMTASETIAIRFVKVKERMVQFVEHLDVIKNQPIESRVICVGCIEQPFFVLYNRIANDSHIQHPTRKAGKFYHPHMIGTGPFPISMHEGDDHFKSIVDLPIFREPSFSQENGLQVISQTQRESDGVRKLYFDPEGRLMKCTFVVEREPTCHYHMTNDYSNQYPYFIPSKVQVSRKSARVHTTVNLVVTKCIVDRGIDESIFSAETVGLKVGPKYQYSDEKFRNTPKSFDGKKIVNYLPELDTSRPAPAIPMTDVTPSNHWYWSVTILLGVVGVALIIYAVRKRRAS